MILVSLLVYTEVDIDIQVKIDIYWVPYLRLILESLNQLRLLSNGP